MSSFDGSLGISSAPLKFVRWDMTLPFAKAGDEAIATEEGIT